MRYIHMKIECFYDRRVVKFDVILLYCQLVAHTNVKYYSILYENVPSFVA